MWILRVAPARIRGWDFFRPSAALVFLSALSLSFLSACGHSKQARVQVPPPPPPGAESTTASSRPEGAAKSDHLPQDAGADLAEPTIPAGAVPIATETGLASWYGPPYHNRRGSNGEIYNMHAMTAAHRTLPLDSIVRVTNLKTGHRALVRITDRGPFIPGRVVDLSLAAAKRLDVYLPGTAEVKLEVMETPAPLEAGGKWAVQIGGFPREQTADKLADHLKRRYHTAKVQSFSSPAGDWWIRVRVQDDDRNRAEKLAAETHSPDGAVFVVRLD
jgi:rare lipoprotein A